MMVSAAAAAAALTISACGGTTHHTTSAEQPPITFATTQPTPTTTVPAPTGRATLGPQNIALEKGPFLAPASTTRPAGPVHGILCQQLQQLAYSAYAHLQVYKNGRSRALPGGIGMVGASASAVPGGLVYAAGTCYYWLHTRAADGVIAVQSPKRHHFTLGDLFAVWRQPLSRQRVAKLHGKVTARVDGKLWHHGIRAIPLREHEDIELAVGRHVPAAQKVDWIASGL